MEKVNIFWFRRDLRLHDNAGLYHALKGALPVVPVFIFDRNILDDLEDKADRRVEFIHNAVVELQKQLSNLGSTLEVYYGFPLDVFKELQSKYDLNEVYINNDYEQYAIDRDEAIENLLLTTNARLLGYKDQVIFEKDEIVKEDGTAYTVFTPYSRKWKATLNDFYLTSYPTTRYYYNFFKQSERKIFTLEQMGFKSIGLRFPPSGFEEQLIKEYTKQRDFPSLAGTSRLGVYLRFGSMSVRELVKKTKEINETYVNELIWREFYQMILWQFPHVRNGESFRREFDKIKWRNNEQEFEAWCKGKTGYPLVDAGMRELNTTGFMHNRVRMVAASFLTKHLLIDWRWGEGYFAKKLLDYEYASNNGGWQWAAGSGCDAAPYFRIFNPTLQAKKFDKDLEYIKKWVKELDSFDYPSPIVNHEMARKRVLQTFKSALQD